MSFHLSCENLHVEVRDGSTYLRAEARREDGSENNTELRLDNIIGNDNGHFLWDGENFTESAEDIRFGIEGGGSVPVLRARLRNENGDYQEADVNLAERVENDNGNLIFT